LRHYYYVSRTIQHLVEQLAQRKTCPRQTEGKLEGRKGKLCRSYKGFGHLAQNCRNRKEEEKGAEMPQNKFEVLKSRVMQCGVEERVVRSVRIEAVRYFKCGEEGHKCRWCPLWKKEKRVAYPKEGKVHQGERRLAHPEKGKAQEKERRLRRAKEEGAVRMAKPQEAQQEEWRRSSWEDLRKRAEWYCGPTVP